MISSLPIEKPSLRIEDQSCRKAILSFSLLFLLSALLLPLTGCERPFIEVTGPRVEVLEPDFSQVLTDKEVIVSVSASSFRAVDRVEVNGAAMTFVEDGAVWKDTLTLLVGTNELVFTAFDQDNVAGSDTAFAVHLPFGFGVGGASLPAPRGGHATTLLNNLAVLVTGGASSFTGEAEDDVFLLNPGAFNFETVGVKLNTPRTGHTASLLPDGRVLLFGGSRTHALNDIGDLVETVEILDPDSDIIFTLQYEGPPIRRAWHTAHVTNSPEGPILSVYGGRGDIQYSPSPRLGTRRDLQQFLLREERLEALSPAPGPFFNDVPGLAGHTQTPLNGGSFTNRFLLAGTFFVDGDEDNVSTIVDFSAPQGIVTTPTEPMQVPRTRHAAASLLPGYVALFGGTRERASEAIDRTEIFIEEAGRYFLLPPTSLPLKRFGHTATKISDQRILLVGGFTTVGTAVAATEFFTLTPTRSSR